MAAMDGGEKLGDTTSERGGAAEFQRRMLEVIAMDHDRRATLSELCLLAERVVPGGLCTIVSVDAEARLRVEAGPSCPPDLLQELDSLLGQNAELTCTHAVRTGELVVVRDVQADERFQGGLEFARKWGIRASWSKPIPAPAGGVTLGAFMITVREPGEPEEELLHVLDAGAQPVSILLEKERVRCDLQRQSMLLESLLESVEDPIFVKDRGGRYLLANSAEAEGLATTPDEMIGRTGDDFYSPEQAERNRETDREVFDTRAGTHYEQEFDNPLHGKRTFLIRKSPMLGRDGEPFAVVGIGRDITDLRRSEQAVRRTQKLESLGLLAGGVAHDFNNLLTGMLGNAELLIDELPPKSRPAALLEEIRSAATRASELVGQILTYSASGQLEREAVDLKELTVEMANLLQTTRREPVQFDLPGDLPMVLAHASEIRQIVMNLLTNACEAVGPSQGSVKVRLREEQLFTAHTLRGPRAGAQDDLKPGRYLCLSVSDTGAGMEEDVLERIFDPFFTTKSTGRGLGLAAVLGIVRGHGGGIEVVSRPGSGATFRVFLPTTEGAVQSRRSRSFSAWRGSGCVLVVEDEPSVLQLTRRVLELRGLQVLEAEDGQAAVELVEARVREGYRAAGIDVVVLDRTTPRLEGPQALAGLRAAGCTAPVILTSGFHEDDAVAGFAPTDLEEFLHKPYSKEGLVRAVAEVLGARGRVEPAVDGPSTPRPGDSSRTDPR